MSSEIKSLKQWQRRGFYTVKTEVLSLSQTYKAWLAENPNGYMEESLNSTDNLASSAQMA